MNKASDNLISFLNLTKSLFINKDKMIVSFQSLTEADLDLVFTIISKPDDWETKDLFTKATFIGRFNNGLVLRNHFNI